VPSALIATDLAKRYGTTHALRGVDLAAEPGSVVGLIGPNGAGKSTLVKIACGLVRASAGTITIGGSPAGSLTARRTLGYLAELFRFPDWASADEVLAFHQRLAGSDAGAGERERLLSRVGLGDARDMKVREMSKGMQQRLGIAQALVGEPQLLLLDEPTSALDPAGRRIVRDLLIELRAQGRAVLINSHLLSEVEKACDQVAILFEGRIVAAGTPEEIARPGGVEIETAAGTRRFPDAARESVPQLVADLVAQGEQIYEVRMLRDSLEEAYLKLVGKQAT
jgi:ABC-2 type transport system ATP-binding protein